MQSKKVRNDLTLVAGNIAVILRLQAWQLSLFKWYRSGLKIKNEDTDCCAKTVFGKNNRILIPG
jgi:hypothetical protein